MEALVLDRGQGRQVVIGPCVAVTRQKFLLPACCYPGWHRLSSVGVFQHKALPAEEIAHMWLRECGGGGDCLFHAVGYALGKSMPEVRTMAAESISDANATLMVERWAQDRLLPAAAVHEKEAKLVPQLRVLLQRPAVLQGDDLVLEHLLVPHPYFQQRNLGFMVLTAFHPTPVKQKPPVLVVQTHSSQQQAPNTNKRFMLLYCNGAHWQLLGRQCNNEREPKFLVSQGELPTLFSKCSML